MIGAMTATVDNLVHNSRILPKNLTFPSRDGGGRHPPIQIKSAIKQQIDRDCGKQSAFSACIRLRRASTAFVHNFPM